MRHQNSLSLQSRQALVTRQRFAFAGAIVVGALMPFALRLLGAGQPGPCRRSRRGHEKLQYDFFYIKYFSPWLDLLILFRTIKTMLKGFGSR